MRNFYIFLGVLSAYFYAYFLHISMRTFYIFLCVISTYFYA